MRLIKACFSILRIQLISKLQFRAAAWASMSTFIIYGFIHAVIIQIFYRYSHSDGGMTAGMTMSQAVSYVWLVRVIAHVLPGMSTDTEVWEKIKSGDVGIELCRPLDLYAHWFSRSFGRRLAPMLMQSLPIVVAAGFMPRAYRLAPPASIHGFLAALLALAGALILCCTLAIIAYALLMNIHWGEGPANITTELIMVFSGALLPLQLWPDWAQRILFYQPFAGLVDIPLRLYVGTMEPGVVYRAVGVQLVWTAFFVFIGRNLMAKHLKRMVIQGG